MYGSFDFFKETIVGAFARVAPGSKIYESRLKFEWDIKYFLLVYVLR